MPSASDDPPVGPGEATRLLARWADGDAEAGERLLPLIYDDLRTIARRHLADERPGHTLDPTALVHEAWLRLDGAQRAGSTRARYLAFASRVMRSLLVDHARRRDAGKRGGGIARVALEGAGADRSEVGVLEIDELLERLAAVDETLGRIAELRIFAGLTQEEVAESLGLAKRTLERRWNAASAWLRRELTR